MVADVGGALAEAGGFFDFAEAFEFAFEALQGVDGAKVGVAAGFEKICTVDEFEAAEVAEGPAGSEAKKSLERSRMVWVALSMAVVRDAFGAEEGFGVAG